MRPNAAEDFDIHISPSADFRLWPMPEFDWRRDQMHGPNHVEPIGTGRTIYFTNSLYPILPTAPTTITPPPITTTASSIAVWT
jgi:hypothetical protein